MNIGTKIRNARKKKELSQETLASALGLTVQAVSKWECRLSYPDISILPELAEELDGRVKVGKVNVDEEAALALKYQIMSIPTFVVMEYGVFKEKSIGAQSKEELKNLLHL